MKAEYVYSAGDSINQPPLHGFINKLLGLTEARTAYHTIFWTNTHFHFLSDLIRRTYWLEGIESQILAINLQGILFQNYFGRVWLRADIVWNKILCSFMQWQTFWCHVIQARLHRVGSMIKMMVMTML